MDSSIGLSLPTGTLTLFLTDIEGSSQLWERHSEAMKEAISRHDRIIREAVESHRGAQPVEQGEGDSTLTAFQSPSDALACALQIQRQFASEPWPPLLTIRVRAALHTGEVELRDERRYWGPAINRCARLRAIGHGGQTLVSSVTHDLMADRLPAEVTFKDMGIHHLRDLATPEHVYQLCHPEIPEEFPPLLSLEAFPNNLPLQLKSFVPREREIEEIRQRIGENRLVTITGAGGSGKTRLALHVAAESFEQYPGGVWLVDLAPVTDPDLVLEAVAKAIRLPMVGGAAGAVRADPRTLIEKVIGYLRLRKTLLILDNCEHMLDACSDLSAELVQECPDLTILVTSREPLGVDGESTWRVPSMSIPGSKEPLPPETLGAFQAVRLFAERASAVRSDFAVTHENAPAIAEIVRRFDGIPLAIELAAARVNILSPAQIASMLGDQFRLLAGGSRKALERQQTMRASIDWSYKHLSEAEQTLLRRLSVFAGGASLEAIEVVCWDDLVAAPDVLDLLSHLVQKSLLEAVESRGRVRYRFLEMIRQYAGEKFNDSGESETIRTRQRDFFMHFADQAEREMRTGRDETPWLEAIASDYENIRAAFDWSVDRGEKEEALIIVSSLWRSVWAQWTIGEEVWAWLEAAFALEGEVSLEILGRAYLTRAYASALTGRSYEDRRISGEKGAEAFERAAAPSPLKALALVFIAVHTFDETRWRFFDAAVRAARELGEAGDVWAKALALALEGVAAVQRGDYSNGRRLLEAAQAEETHYGYLSQDSQSWLVLAAMAERDYQGARRYAESELEIWGKRGEQLRVADALHSMATVSLAEGRPEMAREELGQSLEILRSLGDAHGIAHATYSLGEVEEAGADLDAARKLYSESLEFSRKTGNIRVAVECLSGLSRLKRAEGNIREAVRLVAEAVRLERHQPASARRLAETLVDIDVHAAARLFGAYGALARGGYIAPNEAADYEVAMHRARESVGDADFSALLEEGAKLGLAQTLDDALEAADRISGTP